MRKFFFYWLPLLTWMGVIFFFSARQHFTITPSALYDFLIFKMLHMIEYATLYFLMFRAIYSVDDKSFSRAERLVLCIFLAVIYAVTDEIHQTFTPTREGRIRDVLIDTAGILLMYSYIRYGFSQVKKFIV